MTDEHQSSEPAGEGGKEPRDLGSLAMRDVRRARRLVADAKGESIPEESMLLLGIANALALLDLAAAIRQHKAG